MDRRLHSPLVMAADVGRGCALAQRAAPGSSFRRHVRVEDDVRELAGPPLGVEERPNLLAARTGSRWASPMAMKAQSQLHWWG